MVSRQDVEMAYRLILGREPDSEESLRGHMANHESVDQLRHTFFGSEEFRTAVRPELVSGKPLVWPPIPVETEVSPAQLQEMIARVERNFRHMGETEPHWSVLTYDRYKAENIATTEREFFDSGRGVVDEFRATAARSGVDLRAIRSVLELGCGVGRSTIWLAQMFPKVFGADVSEPHLKIAAEAARAFGHANIELLHVDTIARLADLPPIDGFFSIIVLQHNPPPLICHILRTVLGKLNPNGVAYFQIPTYARGYTFDAGRYLATPVALGEPEMHVVPQAALLDLITQAGCRLLELREDDASGGSFISNRVLVKKVA